MPSEAQYCKTFMHDILIDSFLQHVPAKGKKMSEIVSALNKLDLSSWRRLHMQIVKDIC